MNSFFFLSCWPGIKGVTFAYLIFVDFKNQENNWPGINGITFVPLISSPEIKHVTLA